MKLVVPHHGLAAGREQRWFREGDERMQNAFTLDPVIGFRPRLSTDLFNEFGTRVNGYEIEKSGTTTRLLFLGDSITARGKIMDGLRDLYGDEAFEYWNAGVESFNVFQEVEYYKEYNAAVRPDHVILSFHNNDFEPTPVAFRQRGKLVVYTPKRPLNEVNPWLFQHSHVYRLILGLDARRERLVGDRFAANVRETEASLLELKGILEADGIRLTVLLLPLFKLHEDWTVTERRSREEALRILEEHGFAHFDLLGVLEEAIRDGIPIEESAHDAWHPSDELAERFASFLETEAFLEPEP